MDLDDQLAALAAGELDDATARALTARAAADPVLARRLARFRRLDAVLRVPQDAPAMAPDAVARLDARLDEALAALDEGPLVAPPDATTPSTPRRTSTPPPATGGVVLDLGAARARRWGLPGWAAPAMGAAAAAVLALALAGPLTGGFDDEMAVESTEAGSDRIEAAEEDVAEEDASLEAGTLGVDEEMGDGGAEGAAETTEEAPVVADEEQEAPVEDVELARDLPVVGFDLAAGEEFALLDRVREDFTFGAAPTRAAQLEVLAGLGGPAAGCATDLLTASPDGRVVLALGLGTWEGEAAVAVVLGGVDPAAPAEVVVTDPGCTELARAVEVG